MTERGKLVPALGVSALVLFVAMAVILQVFVSPHIGFLPQAELGAYSDLDLVQLGQDLRASGQDFLYKCVIFFMDAAFFILFFLFAFAVHLYWSSGTFRVVAIAFLIATVAIDFAENMMIGARVGLLTKGNLDPGRLSSGISAVHWVTLTKFAGYAISLFMLLSVRRRT